VKVGQVLAHLHDPRHRRVGVPQVTVYDGCRRRRPGHPKSPTAGWQLSDIAKVIAAGADVVMLGSMSRALTKRLAR
jgi:hypothetical protein